MTSPVSIVIPTYNRAALVCRAVESALAAADREDEILVIDDASTDNTAEVLARFGDRIRYIKAPHGGAGAARNLGVAASAHRLVAFLDSDDEWLADKLQLQRTVMHHRPEVMYCFSDFAVRDRSGRTLARYLKNWHRDPRPWDQILGPAFRYSSIAPLPRGRDDFPVYVGDLYLPLLSRLYIGTFTLLFRKDLPGGVPQFPTDLPTYEDWQFFGELARRGPGAYLDCETAVQHGHDLPRLTDADALVEATTRIRLIERVWGADADFLVRHGDIYRAVMREQQQRQRLYTGKKLLMAGRTREARSAFAGVEDCPARYRMLAYLPGGLVRRLARLRGRLRVLFRGA
jgi:glycosyltransferase involved in cell wall biosynthesis